MRLLTELFLIVLLIWLGWDKSFHAWTNQWRGIKPPPGTAQVSTATATGAAAPPAAPQPFVGYRRPQPAATASGEWMWDPAHRSNLDPPASEVLSHDARDSGVKTYWIDGKGVRHYYSMGAQPPSPSP